MTRLVLVWLALSVSGCLCSTVTSKGVPTEKLYARLDVTSTGDNTRVQASFDFSDLSGRYVRVQPPDVLTAFMGQDALPMAASTLLGITSHDATFPRNTGDEWLFITLDRQEATSARESSVSLPWPFTITAPPAETPVPYGSRLTVDWDVGLPDVAKATLDGACIVKQEVTVAAGQPWVEFGEVVPSDKSKPEGCSLTATVEVVREGTRDPAFRGGHMTATVTRTLALNAVVP